MAEETEEKKVAAIDPMIITFAVLQVVDIFTRILSPSYVPPTVEQVEELRNRLANTPDLELYTGKGFFYKIKEKFSGLV